MTRKKEIDEAERKKELLRKLRKGPDLDKYVDDKKRRYTSYAGGARIYSMSYYTFIKLAKEAGANVKIKKNVVVDLDVLEKYIEENCEGGPKK
nr:DUF6462 family protein [uncultured Butyrivibrio sp.]